MKRTLIVVALSLVAACGLFANGQKETVTVEGKLAVKDSVPTIVSGDKTYTLPIGPFYQIAWENGLKAGDTVKVEGYVAEPRANGNAPVNAPANAPAAAGQKSSGTAAAPAAQASAGADQSATFLMPKKVWVNGKEINLSSLRTGPRGSGMGPGRGQGMGQGMRDRRNGGGFDRNGADCPMWD